MADYYDPNTQIVNLGEIPTDLPKFEPGIYLVSIDEADVKPTRSGTGENLVLKMSVIDTESSLYQRSTYDHIFLGGTPTQLAQLCVCGVLPKEPLPLEDIRTRLVGGVVKIRVGSRTYTDSQGMQKQATDVLEYLPATNEEVVQDLPI
jgi:hypothetical protein